MLPNFDKLIEPIGGDSATGVDLRLDDTFDSPYHRLKDHYRELRRQEKQHLDGEAQAQSAEWHKIVQQAGQILAESSKDLEICAWLIEALTRQEGFAGFTQGYQLTQLLIDQYWDQLFPKADDEGDVGRIAALIGLNGLRKDGTLITIIYSIPLLYDTDNNPITSWHCQQTSANMPLLEKAARNASLNELEKQKDSINQAIQIFQHYADSIDAKFSDTSAIPHSAIKQALNDALKSIDTLISIHNKYQQNSIQTEEASDPKSSHQLSKEKAIQQLSEIAAFYRDIEPHSPVSYLLERAVNWSQLTLPELLQVMIPEGDMLDLVSKISGVEVDIDHD